MAVTKVISSCEAGLQWPLALHIFDEMRCCVGMCFYWWFNGVNPPCFWVNCRITSHQDFTPKFKHIQMVFFPGRNTQFLELFSGTERFLNCSNSHRINGWVGSLVWWLTCPNRSPKWQFISWGIARMAFTTQSLTYGFLCSLSQHVKIIE